MHTKPPTSSGPDALVASAMQLHQRGELDQAGKLYQQALRLAPNHVDALHLYGLVLHQRGMHAQAVDFIQRAVALVPGQPQLLNNLAEAQRGAGDAQGAIASLREALKLKPDYAGAHMNLATAYGQAGDYDAALRHAREAARLTPDSAEAHFNLGLALLDQLELDKAVASFRAALGLRPGYRTAAGNLLHLLTLIPGYDAEEVARQHRLICESLYGPTQPSKTQIRDEPSRPLRIGYVSRDFRTHAVNFFLEPVLARHDREHFEIFCYSDVYKLDAVTRRLRGLGHHWRPIAGCSDEETVQKINDDQIDILVDLAGHTEKNRLAVFARKPAPVQISWLGYPNTTGVAAMDYRIVDAVSAPPTESFPGTERALRLPHVFACFRPPADAPAISPAPAMATGRITFGSLHKLEKLNTGVIELWSRILHALPDTQLLIARDQLDTWHRQWILDRFDAHGIDPGRLILRHIENPSRTFLEVFADVDVLLDVFPWSGHTLACCSLWMGVPVLSLRGATHAGRMTAGVLEAIGLDWLVAEDQAAYTELAAQLAGDIAGLAELRAGLRERVANSPLRDEAGFTRALERAYREVWASAQTAVRK